MFLFLVENIVVWDVSMTPLLGSGFYIFLVPNYASLEKSRLLNITLVRTQKYQQEWCKSYIWKNATFSNFVNSLAIATVSTLVVLVRAFYYITALPCPSKHGQIPIFTHQNPTDMHFSSNKIRNIPPIIFHLWKLRKFPTDTFIHEHMLIQATIYIEYVSIYKMGGKNIIYYT